MNKQVAVVGKVNNGRMTTLAVAGDRVVGHSRPITPLGKPIITSAPHTPHKVYTYEPIDSPFISMVQDNHKRIKAEKEARMQQLEKENIRNRRIRKIMNLFK